MSLPGTSREPLQNSSPTLDNAPVTAFHRRMVLVAMGGPFCDGYLLGIMGVALSLITPALALDTLWTGLVAASVLVGVFLGGAVFGPITDRAGRHLMYVLNLAAFVIGSALQFFVTEAWQLLVLRLFIGIAIGADYPIASALTTELVPRRMRGPALSGLVLAWWIGYGISYWAGWLLLGTGDDAWRWMLASGAVPAVLFLLLRAGVPESPRWLASRDGWRRPGRSYAATSARRSAQRNCSSSPARTGAAGPAWAISPRCSAAAMGSPRCSARCSGSARWRRPSRCGPSSRRCWSPSG
ncbi:Sialic acid transporter NanT [Streptomyces antimycoticus]